MTRVTIRFDRRCQRAQIRQDGADTGLRRVRAVAIASTAIYSRGRAIVTKSAVTVLDPPIVGSRNWVGIFYFVHRTTCIGHLVVGRHAGVAVLVAEPDGISKTQHDAVRTSPADDRLVVVIAHRVVVGKFLGIWRVALQYV